MRRDAHLSRTASGWIMPERRPIIFIYDFRFSIFDFSIGRAFLKTFLVRYLFERGILSDR